MKQSNFWTSLDSIIWKMLLLFLILTPLQILNIDFHGRALYISDMFFLPLFMLWCISKLKFKLRLPPLYICLPFILLFISQSASTVLSENIHKSIFSLAGKLYLIAMLFLVYDSVRNRERGAVLMKTLLVSYIIVILGGIIGIVLFYAGIENNPFHWGYGQLAPGNYPRLKATLQCPQELGMFFALSFYIMIGILTYLRPRHWQYMIVALLSLSTLVGFFSLARDVYGICSGFAALVFLFWLKRKYFCITSVILVSIIALVVFILFNISNLIYITPIKVKLHANKQIEDMTFDYEIGKGSQQDKNGWIDDTLIVVNTHYHNKYCYIIDLIENLKRKPVCGIGVGLPGSTHNLEKNKADMHNTYFQLLVQQGALGAVAGALCVFAITVFAFKSASKMSWSNYLVYAYFIAAFFAILGSAFFNHHLNNRVVWVAIAVLLVLGEVLSQRQQQLAEE